MAATTRALDRAQGEVDQTRAELAEQRQAAAAAHAQLATVSGQLHAAQERLETEKAYAAERLADQRARAERAERVIAQLQDEMAKLRGRGQGD